MATKKRDEFYSGLMVEAFDKITTEAVYKERSTKIVKLIKKHNPKAKILLELACGTGNFTKQLAKVCFIITATDIAKDEIEKAKTKSIDAKFSVADMSKLRATSKYDVVCCFWESFRYLPNYKVCEDTLKRIFKALKKDGLFFVDFTHFPPHNKPFKIPTYTIKIGNGLVLLKDTYIITRGNLDTRWDEMRYLLHGKDVTDQKIEWGGKSILLKQRLNRAPLLRIDQKKMEKMLAKAGFNILEVQDNFAGCPESMLFVAQKIK
jgi:ubiquinone/menaquinone biosynthesis C-methylase UbiE